MRLPSDALKELLVSDGVVAQEQVGEHEQQVHWGASAPIFLASMTPGSTRSKSNAGSFNPPRKKDCIVITPTLLLKRIWLRDHSG
jgi:hypothetical protein